jgi:hypothetical protein
MTPQLERYGKINEDSVTFRTDFYLSRVHCACHRQLFNITMLEVGLRGFARRYDMVMAIDPFNQACSATRSVMSSCY